MNAALPIALIAAGLVVVLAARDRVRTIIGAELVVLGAIAAAVSSGDPNMVAVASAIGVADTLLLVAAAFKLSHD
ncbi:MAG: ferredoxin:quinone oxidoreductase [Thermoproteus sp.]